MKSENVKIITEELFYMLTIALAVFVVMEIIKPRMILNYFNLNILLILWLLNAIILLVNSKKSV
jgi:hypothetical protein